MLPLHTSFTPRNAKRSGCAGLFGDSLRQKLFLLGTLILVTFTLVLIMIANADMERFGAFVLLSPPTPPEAMFPKSNASFPLSSVLPPRSMLYPHCLTSFLCTRCSTVDGESVYGKHGNEATIRPMKRQNLTSHPSLGGDALEQVTKPSGRDSSPSSSANRVGVQSTEDVKTERRRGAIVKAFKHAWDAYVRHCGDHDEVNPVSKKCRDWFNLGLTRIDALDTMYLMGFEAEFKESVAWLDKHFNLDQNTEVLVFEGVIRILGGLLSAYDLSKDPTLLTKAKNFADRLMPAFEVYSSGIPSAIINLQTGHAHTHGWLHGQVVLSEIGTVQMELSYLSHVTREPAYANVALNVFKTLRKHSLEPGLYATQIKPEDGHASNNVATLNAPGDSMYEYVFKTWLLMNKKISWLGDMWEESANAILGRLRGTSGEHVYVASLSGGALGTTVEQLACFAGGLFALAANHTTTKVEHDRRLEFGRDFTKFCRTMYFQSKSGLAPELVTVSGGQIQYGGELTFQLRPETLESLFYLYRATGNPMYRDWAWEIFEAIEKHCKVADGGYTGVRDIMTENPTPDDVQPSWFLAESLKYLFLTFSNADVVPLDKYVFNTEAHPLSIFTPDLSTVE